MPEKAPIPKPFDRRPWPTIGDRELDITYAAVGRALSSWERFEGILSLLFSAFVVNMEREGARRAYSAVRTFEGRAEMLKAASEAYFMNSPMRTNSLPLSSFSRSPRILRRAETTLPMASLIISTSKLKRTLENRVAASPCSRPMQTLRTEASGMSPIIVIHPSS